MSVDTQSVQPSSDTSASARTEASRFPAANDAHTKAPTIQPLEPSHSALDDIVQLGDALLGDEMSILGDEVDSWNPSSSTRSAASPTFSQNQASGNFTSRLNTPLVRHVSLPASFIHHYKLDSFDSSSCNSTQTTLAPSLARQKTLGYIYEHDVVTHPSTLYAPTNSGYLSAESMHGLELGVSHQNHQSMAHMKGTSDDTAVSSDPIVLQFGGTSIDQNSKDRHDIGAMSFPAYTSQFSMSGPNSKGIVKSEMQQFESALESLNNFLPEMDQDLFQPSELNSMPPPSMPKPMYENSPRLSVSIPQGPTQLMISPHLKPLASSLSMLPSHRFASSPSDASSISGTPRNKINGACKVTGCDRRVRSKGLCKTHGGGRKCSILGCRKSSQNGDFCIGHGGGKKCKEEACAKAAQSHGLCKAHGGGARCKFPDCNKSSQGGGLCRAHGGGKRCQAVGCPKGAQRGNFCATHGGFRNCNVEGCVRTDRGGGYCEVHRRGRLCKVDGCKKLSRNQGLCTMHIREEKQEYSFQSDALSPEILPVSSVDVRNALLS